MGYTLEPGIFEFSDNELMLKSLLPDVIKVNITIDDIRLRWNLTTIKIIRFTKKTYLNVFFRFYSKPFGDSI